MLLSFKCFYYYLNNDGSEKKKENFEAVSSSLVLVTERWLLG